MLLHTKYLSIIAFYPFERFEKAVGIPHKSQVFHWYMEFLKYAYKNLKHGQPLSEQFESWTRNQQHFS